MGLRNSDNPLDQGVDDVTPCPNGQDVHLRRLNETSGE